MYYRTFLIFAILCQAVAQKINTVDGYPLEWLRAPQPGTPPAASNAQPTPVPLRPLSMRTIYRTTNPSITPTTNDRLLILEGNAFQRSTVKAKLIPPTATSCTSDQWSGGPFGAHEYTGSTSLPSSNVQRGQFSAQFLLPLRYQSTPGRTQATRNMELAHEFMWPWLCVCVGETDALCDANWIHTNMRYAPLYRCDGNDGGANNTHPNHDPNQQVDLCAYQNGALTTNPPLTINGHQRNTFDCSIGECDYNAAPPVVSQIAVTNLASPQAIDPMTGRNEVNLARGNHLWRERLRRTVCCGWSRPGVTTRHFGICINPLIEGCCERGTSGIGKPFSLFREKCCYGGAWPANSEPGAEPVPTQVPAEPVIISYLDDWCPCTVARVDQFCNQVNPSTGSTNKCCVKTKYPEINDGSGWGKCYDGFKEQCCDTGDIYDPGTYQCCKINGIQNVNVPCPCGADGHCGANQTCCQDVSKRRMFPTPQEKTQLCSKYVNYPLGSGVAQVQPCIGQCMDTRFQMCCNGMVCQQEYEVCCNNTCCNKFVQRCTIGTRPGAQGQFNNPRDFRIFFEVCTTIEAMTPIRATLMYFTPLILLLATFLGLAFTLFFAKRQNSLQPLSTYEKAMFGLACGVILFAWPLYFSALWKYAVGTIWASFFTIMAALSQIRPLNIAAIALNGFLLIYLVDPFHGSEIFTLALDRPGPRLDSVHGTSGVLSSIFSQYDNDQVACTSFYDYFKRDPATEDRLRWDNPHKMTFGFCSRDWFTALGIFECIALMLVFLLFFVSLITHIRNVLFSKAEKTEEVVGWY